MSDQAFVRTAVRADLEDVAALFDEYRMFYGQTSDRAGAKSYLADRMNREESVIFVAVDPSASRPIGFTQLYPSFSSISMKRVWILNDLFVAEPYRGRGIAQRLLDLAKEHAGATKAKGLALSTAVDNVAAQRLYEKNGYVRDTEFYHYFLSV